MRNSDPPVCAPHGRRGIGAPRGNQNRRTHGLYSHHPGQGADIDPAATEFTLWREIGLTRLVISEVLGVTPPESWDTLPLTLNLRAYYCMFTGAKTGARLKLTEKKIKQMKLASGPGIFQNSAPSLDHRWSMVQNTRFFANTSPGLRWQRSQLSSFCGSGTLDNAYRCTMAILAKGVWLLEQCLQAVCSLV